MHYILYFFHLLQYNSANNTDIYVQNNQLKFLFDFFQPW